MKDDKDDYVLVVENGIEFYKDSKEDLIWSVTTPETRDTYGSMLFSFDRKKIFNFFQDYPDKLTEEQIKIFQKENPTLAELKPL